LVTLDAVLSVQPLLEELLFRVNVVKDIISVILLTSSENYHLIELGKFL